MKKSIYTLAFVALVQFAVSAQSKEQTKPTTQTKQENVNPDGTLAPAQSQQANPVFTQPKQTEVAPNAAGTTISEMPATSSKGSNKATKSTTPAKTAEPAKSEPAKTEKK